MYIYLTSDKIPPPPNLKTVCTFIGISDINMKLSLFLKTQNDIVQEKCSPPDEYFFFNFLHRPQIVQNTAQ
jgi:hypothetical protein